METPHLKLRGEIESLYTAYPYPPVGYLSPIIQKIRQEDRTSMNYRAAFSAAYGNTKNASLKPRILVAGCGTFEPVVVALANPGAQILAVDLSARSIRRLEWQARVRGLQNRIQTWVGDFEELPERFGKFDFVIATGVLHHLPDPEKGLRSLVALAGESGVFRFMIYSYWGRALLYSAKALGESLGIENPASFRKMIESLPSGHPYKIYFHLYEDTRTDSGIADGFLHPCDKPFTAYGLRDLLTAANLDLTKHLHSQEGQPEAVDRLVRLPVELGAWDRLAILEWYGELQTNFTFFACRSGWRSNERTFKYEWNRALPRSGRLNSSLAGRVLNFNTRRDPCTYGPEEIRDLVNALFLLPTEEV